MDSKKNLFNFYRRYRIDCSQIIKKHYLMNILLNDENIECDNFLDMIDFKSFVNPIKSKMEDQLKCK